MQNGEMISSMKKAMKRVIYGRTIIVVLCLLIQLATLFVSFFYLEKYITFIFGSFTVLSLIVTIYIINTNQSPYYKLAWIIPVLVIPVFGTLFYLWVELQPGPKAIHKRVKQTTERMLPALAQNKEIADEISAIDAGEASFVHYMNRYANSAIYKNTQATFFASGEEKMAALLPELENAKEFIFMEYFIVEYGLFWESVLAILKRKAAEGVEVRMMYDGSCEFALLPHFYPAELAKFGIKAKAFSPFSPVFSTHQNNRDHRKICVIDGKIGITGGINLGDEYINAVTVHGHWKDTAIMIKGDAVRGLTMLYLQLWSVREKQDDDYTAYLRDVPMPAKGYIMPYGDSPLDKESVGQQVYMDILNRAEQYVYIMTPYLIIDDQMQHALTYAAKRGVDVRIIMPHVPDKPPVWYLGRTYYRHLIEAGVRVYEYTPGFVHAKIFISDNKRATVGTVNLDYRSLYLHFECGAYLFETPVIADIMTDYHETLLQCEEVTVETCKKIPMLQWLFGRILRLFAPLM
ncbi:MAG: cardiolipin synthase [Ruthenibacterium sp.]